MLQRVYIFFVLLILFDNGGTQKSHSRQKRCIVIQKQSGSHGDSFEDEADDSEETRYPRPHPKDLRKPNTNHKFKPNFEDIETFPPELLKYMEFKPNVNKRHLVKGLYQNGG